MSRFLLCCVHQAKLCHNPIYISINSLFSKCTVTSPKLYYKPYANMHWFYPSNTPLILYQSSTFSYYTQSNLVFIFLYFFYILVIIVFHWSFGGTAAEHSPINCRIQQ